MKNITTHHDGFGLNDLIEVRASDEDANGVPHRIEFWRKLEEKDHKTTSIDGMILVGFLQMQHGPRNEPDSRPGLITDAVFAALIAIMQGFQAGPFKSKEGAMVLTKLEEAALWSHKRARDRAARGVLGHNKA